MRVSAGASSSLVLNLPPVSSLRFLDRKRRLVEAPGTSPITVTAKIARVVHLKAMSAAPSPEHSATSARARVVRTEQ